MLPEIERLLVLQDRDRKIRARQQEVKLAPLQRKELETKLTAANAGLDAAKLKARENEVERKKLEGDVQVRRDQIAKFNTQKFQTRKNEEFQALNNEIKRFEEEIQRIEDKELDLMENADQLKSTLAEAEQAAHATRASVQRQLADLETKIQAVETQLTDLGAERTTFAAALDEELVDTYERLFKNKGEAVVALHHDVCTGCHMKVIAQTSVLVRGRKTVVHCENCGRILFPEES